MEGDGCGAALLDRIRTPTDALEVDAAGELTIAGHEARRLLQEFGSPLYVTVEETLRRNYREALAAFQSRWPAGVEIFFFAVDVETLGFGEFERGFGSG